MSSPLTGAFSEVFVTLQSRSPAVSALTTPLCLCFSFWYSH